MDQDSTGPSLSKRLWVTNSTAAGTQELVGAGPRTQSGLNPTDLHGLQP